MPDDPTEDLRGAYEAIFETIGAFDDVEARPLVSFVGGHTKGLDRVIALLDEVPYFVSAVYVQLSPIAPSKDGPSKLEAVMTAYKHAGARGFEVIAGRAGAITPALRAMGLNAADAGLATGETFDRSGARSTPGRRPSADGCSVRRTRLRLLLPRRNAGGGCGPLPESSRGCHRSGTRARDPYRGRLIAGGGCAHSRDLDDIALRVEHLVVEYPARHRQRVQAVSDISFDVRRGETLGLVGESGCGKSTTGRAIMMLPPPTPGSVVFEGREMTSLHGEELRRTRTKVQIIFQDPISSLNPRRKVRDIIGEGLKIWGRTGTGQIWSTR